MMIRGHSGQVQQHTAIPNTVKSMAIRSNSHTKPMQTVFPSWVHLDPFRPCHNINTASATLVTLPTFLAVKLGVLQSLHCVPVP